MKSKLYIGAILVITSVLVLGTVLTPEQAYAQAEVGKVRAIQDGKVLGTEPGKEGLVGMPIDCVGGVRVETANDFHCFLVPEGIGIGTIEWADPDTIADPPDGVKVLSSTDPMSCDGLPGGLDVEDVCFSVQFPADDFTVGEWHFIAVFTEDGEILDIEGIDYRVNSFMVIPEFLFGSIGLVGSLLGTFYLYRRRSVKAKEQ